jgi:hypothetical protein
VRRLCQIDVQQERELTRRQIGQLPVERRHQDPMPKGHRLIGRKFHQPGSLSFRLRNESCPNRNRFGKSLRAISP